jgi:hypothetical protein
MLPKSMQFKAEDPSFAPAQDVSGMNVFMAQNVPPGKEMKFVVSGEGTIPDPSQESGTAAQGQPETAPGGPTAAREGASNSRWYLVTMFVVILAVAAYWLFRVQRRQIPLAASNGTTVSQTPESRDRETAAGTAVSNANTKHSATSGKSVVDAIKEELFQLESDRLLGKISQQEYETAKAGLDLMMRRHANRG